MAKKTKNPGLSTRRLGLKKTTGTDDITSVSQRQRILAGLQISPLTTTEMRRKDILAPAARIFELRHDFNYNIVREWTNYYDSAGRKHRIAKYVLLPRIWNNQKSFKEVTK